MNPPLVIFGSGLLAGAMNALAGGGTFVALPALISVGVPSVQANASSTVGLFPGIAASAWAYRDGLAPIGAVSLRSLLFVTVVGGAIGAWLLMSTPSTTFDSLLPWLLGIAVNVARNAARAARRHRAAMSRLPPAADVPDFADDLAARIDDTVRLELVRAALGRLRRGEREVVALCVWSGLSYAQAAGALGVPVGTVRSRLSRARGKLQRFADAAGRDPGGGEPGQASEQVEGDRESAVRSPWGGTR